MLYILALFIPPLAVFLDQGIGKTFWINLLLSVLGLVPGIIHAWIVLGEE